MRRRTGREAQQENKRILARSTLCHICGHQGADAVDHVIPIAAGGADTPDNKRPAHHTAPCPTCGTKCNRTKATKIVPQQLRRSSTLNR